MSYRSKTQVYIGDFTRSTYPEDIEDTFKEFGKVRDFAYKGRYAFVDYEDP